MSLADPLLLVTHYILSSITSQTDDQIEQHLINLPALTRADDEIDLREVAATLHRQKKLIATFSGVAVVLSTIFAITREPTWEGQFQIVLGSQNQNKQLLGTLLQIIHYSLK